MGLEEEELQPLVDMWRSANPNIVKFWWEVDRAVKKAVKEKESSRIGNIIFLAEVKCSLSDCQAAENFRM